MFYEEAGFGSAVEALGNLSGLAIRHTTLPSGLKMCAAAGLCAYAVNVSVWGGWGWSGTRWITSKLLKYLDSMPE